MEEACDLYARAANMFKMAKNWCGKKLCSQMFDKVSCLLHAVFTCIHLEIGV